MGAAQQLMLAATAAAGDTGPRYWRLQYLNSQNSTERLFSPDIQLRTSPGGANISSGKTYAMEAGRWAGTADEPWDGNELTNLGSVYNTTSGWVSVDLGAGNGAEVVEVYLSPNNTESNIWQYLPKALNVQYSNDNVTWTTSWSVADAGFWFNFNPVTLTKP